MLDGRELEQHIQDDEQLLEAIDRDVVKRSVGLSANQLDALMAKRAERRKPIEARLRANRKALRDRVQ